MKEFMDGNPQMVAQMVAQLAQTNPQIMSAIQSNPQALDQILQDPQVLRIYVLSFFHAMHLTLQKL